LVEAKIGWLLVRFKVKVERVYKGDERIEGSRGGRCIGCEYEWGGLGGGIFVRKRGVEYSVSCCRGWVGMEGSVHATR
jgi:hypothetical protein